MNKEDKKHLKFQKTVSFMAVTLMFILIWFNYFFKDDNLIVLAFHYILASIFATMFINYDKRLEKRLRGLR